MIGLTVGTTGSNSTAVLETAIISRNCPKWAKVRKRFQRRRDRLLSAGMDAAVSFGMVGLPVMPAWAVMGSGTPRVDLHSLFALLPPSDWSGLRRRQGRERRDQRIRIHRGDDISRPHDGHQQRAGWCPHQVFDGGHRRFSSR